MFSIYKSGSNRIEQSLCERITDCCRWHLWVCKESISYHARRQGKCRMVAGTKRYPG